MYTPFLQNYKKLQTFLTYYPNFFEQSNKVLKKFDKIIELIIMRFEFIKIQYQEYEKNIIHHPDIHFL